MTLIASIDGPTRRVYLHADTVGADVHPVDIYKEMRVLRRNSEALRGYDLFMKASGNEEKGGGKFTERYVTLLLGTRLVPFDTTHELTITGTVITDDGQEGIAAFDRASLSPTTAVDINYVPPQVEVIEVSSGSGLSAEQDSWLSQVHGQVFREVYVNTELATNGNGYQQSPFNNLTDAVDSAEALGLTGLVVLADIVIDRQLKNFLITGVGLPTVDFNGQILSGSKFLQCRVEGVFTNPIIAEECVLLNGVALNGYYQNCSLAGDLICVDGSEVVMDTCMSNIAGLGRPSVSMNAAGTCKLSVRGHRGGFDLRDCNQVTDEATVEVNPGSVSVASSCTQGVIVLRGVGLSQINTVADIVTDEMVHSILPSEILEIATAVWDYATSAASTVGSMGEFVTKKLLTFIQFLGLK